MANFLAPVINGQQFDANGDPLSGGEIFVYLAGTSTAATTYTTKAGGTPNTFPIDLNTLGVNEDGEIWLVGGASYKFVIKDSAGVTLRTLDNMSGVNDTAVTTDQWLVYQTAPTFVSTTSFTVPGDQTQTFQVGRRVKTTNTGGTIYSTITASVYGAPNTTVTVRNDSGVLDSGLSQVSYGLISIQNSSLTGLLLNIQTFLASGTYTPTAGTTRIIVKGQGAGGAGGGGTGTAAGQVSIGSGGGAGGIGETLVSSGFSGATVTIGAGGTGNSGLAGSAGGATSFGTFLTLNGGAGGLTAASGAAVVVAGAAGGAASLGSVYIQPGQNSSGGGASNAAGFACGTAGANSLYGGGGAPGAIGVGVAAIAAGGAATGRGAGGGGAAAVSGSGAVGGGAGTGGILIVYEFA